MPTMDEQYNQDYSPEQQGLSEEQQRQAIEQQKSQQYRQSKLYQQQRNYPGAKELDQQIRGPGGGVAGENAPGGVVGPAVEPAKPQEGLPEGYTGGQVGPAGEKLPEGATTFDPYGRPYFPKAQYEPGILNEIKNDITNLWAGAMERIHAPVEDQKPLTEGFTPEEQKAAVFNWWDALPVYGLLDEIASGKIVQADLSKPIGSAFKAGPAITGSIKVFSNAVHDINNVPGAIGAISRWASEGIMGIGEVLSVPANVVERGLGTAGVLLESAMGYQGMPRNVTLDEAYQASRIAYDSFLEPALRAEYVRRYRAGENPIFLAMELGKGREMKDLVGKLVLDPLTLYSKAAKGLGVLDREEKASELTRVVADSARPINREIAKGLEAVDMARLGKIDADPLDVLSKLDESILAQSKLSAEETQRFAQEIGLWAPTSSAKANKYALLTHNQVMTALTGVPVDEQWHVVMDWIQATDPELDVIRRTEALSRLTGYKTANIMFSPHGTKAAQTIGGWLRSGGEFDAKKIENFKSMILKSQEIAKEGKMSAERALVDQLIRESEANIKLQFPGVIQRQANFEKITKLIEDGKSIPAHLQRFMKDGKPIPVSPSALAFAKADRKLAAAVKDPLNRMMSTVYFNTIAFVSRNFDNNIATMWIDDFDNIRNGGLAGIITSHKADKNLIKEAAETGLSEKTFGGGGASATLVEQRAKKTFWNWLSKFSGDVEGRSGKIVVWTAYDKTMRRAIGVVFKDLLKPLTDAGFSPQEIGELTHLIAENRSEVGKAVDLYLNAVGGERRTAAFLGEGLWTQIQNEGLEEDVRRILRTSATKEDAIAQIENIQKERRLFADGVYMEEVLPPAEYMDELTVENAAMEKMGMIEPDRVGANIRGHNDLLARRQAQAEQMLDSFRDASIDAKVQRRTMGDLNAENDWNALDQKIKQIRYNKDQKINAAQTLTIENATKTFNRAKAAEEAGNLEKAADLRHDGWEIWHEYKRKGGIRDQIHMDYRDQQSEAYRDFLQRNPPGDTQLTDKANAMYENTKLWDTADEQYFLQYGRVRIKGTMRPIPKISNEPRAVPAIERRKNTQLRDLFNRQQAGDTTLTSEELKMIHQGIHTDPKFGIQNGRAWELLVSNNQQKPVIAALDLDYLKWYNTMGGHEAGGDQLMQALVDEMHRVVGKEDSFRLHEGGDEFLAQFSSQAEADAKMAELDRAFREKTITFEELDTNGNPTGQEITGHASFGWGVGNSQAEADARLTAIKKEAGIGRNAEPPGVVKAPKPERVEELPGENKVIRPNPDTERAVTNILKEPVVVRTGKLNKADVQSEINKILMEPETQSSLAKTIPEKRTRPTAKRPTRKQQPVVELNKKTDDLVRMLVNHDPSTLDRATTLETLRAEGLPEETANRLLDIIYAEPTGTHLVSLSPDDLEYYAHTISGINPSEYTRKEAQAALEDMNLFSEETNNKILDQLYSERNVAHYNPPAPAPDLTQPLPEGEFLAAPLANENQAPTLQRAAHEGYQGFTTLMDRVKKRVERDWDKMNTAAATPQMNPAKQAALENFAGIVEKRLYGARAVAFDVADQARKFTLLDYADKKGFDVALSYIMPYQYWYTRTYANWIKRIAQNPHILASYAQYRDSLAKIHAGMPEWWKYNINSNELLGLDSDNPLYFNLEATLNPLNGLTGIDFNDSERQKTGFGQLIDNLGKFGPSIWTPLSIGYGAYLLTQGDQEGAESFIGRLIPATQTIKSVTGALGLTGTSSLLTPGGLELDPSMILQGGMGKYDRRRVGRMLGQMQQEGLITQEQGIDAGYAQGGDIWNEAWRRAEAARAPGNIAAGVLGVGFKGRNPKDMLIDQFFSEMSGLTKQQPNLSPEEYKHMWNVLEERYPFMDTVLLSRRPNDERDQALVYNVLSRIPPGQQNDYAKSVGLDPRLLDMFYQNKGFQKEIGTNQYGGKILQKWDQADKERVMSAIRSIGAVLAVPANTLRHEWFAAKENYNYMNNVQAKQLFGDNILDETDTFYSMKGDQNREDAYLAGHPEVQQYLDWKGQTILANPVLNKYYGGIDFLEQSLRRKMYADFEIKSKVPISQVLDFQSAFYDIKDQGGDTKKFLADHPVLSDWWDFKASRQGDIQAEMDRQAQYFPDTPKAAVRKDAVLQSLGAQDVMNGMNQTTNTNPEYDSMVAAYTTNKNTTVQAFSIQEQIDANAEKMWPDVLTKVREFDNLSVTSPALAQAYYKKHKDLQQYIAYEKAMKKQYSAVQAQKPVGGPPPDWQKSLGPELYRLALDAQKGDPLPPYAEEKLRALAEQLGVTLDGLLSIIQ